MGVVVVFIEEDGFYVEYVEGIVFYLFESGKRGFIVHVGLEYLF